MIENAELRRFFVAHPFRPQLEQGSRTERTRKGWGFSQPRLLVIVDPAVKIEEKRLVRRARGREKMGSSAAKRSAEPSCSKGK